MPSAPGARKRDAMPRVDYVGGKAAWRIAARSADDPAQPTASCETRHSPGPALLASCNAKSARLIRLWIVSVLPGWRAAIPMETLVDRPCLAGAAPNTGGA